MTPDGEVSSLFNLKPLEDTEQSNPPPLDLFGVRENLGKFMKGSLQIKFDKVLNDAELSKWQKMGMDGAFGTVYLTHKNRDGDV